MRLFHLNFCRSHYYRVQSELLSCLYLLCPFGFSLSTPSSCFNPLLRMAVLCRALVSCVFDASDLVSDKEILITRLHVSVDHKVLMHTHA
jgi:hypothetical protein